MTPDFQNLLIEAEAERQAMLKAINGQSVSAASLTRQLYPNASVPGPEYHHIRYRLNQLRKSGILLCDEPKAQQERRYWLKKLQGELL